MENEQETNFWERFSSFMEHDSRAVEIFSYGIACVCLSTALYKIRPFSRFTSPNQVPKHFFTNKVLLEGTVENVELSKPISLLVDHKPLIPLPRFNKSKYLPVKLAGVNVTGNGLSWLQSVVKGKKIQFIPITKDNQFLTCIVMVHGDDKMPICVAKELIKVGFGTVENFSSTSVVTTNVKSYDKSLQLAQKYAERKRNGIWQDKYNPTFTWKLRNILENKLKSKLPEFLVKYFNI